MNKCSLKTLWLIIMVIICCIAMAIIETLIEPTYWVKSVLKMETRRRFCCLGNIKIKRKNTNSKYIQRSRFGGFFAYSAKKRKNT